MKKLVSLFFACVTIISLCLCLSSCDKDQRWKKFSFGENVSALFNRGVVYDISEDGKSAYVRSYIRTPRRLRIKRRFRGRPVTTINAGAFLDCNKLRSVKITKNISKIKDQAFRNCSNLRKVKIAGNVKTIEYHAFAYCESLTDVMINKSIEKIAQSAFEDSKNLENVYIKDLEAWCNIEFTPSYTYSNSLTNGKKLYLNKELVTDLTIPDGVTEIKDYAFAGLLHLTTVTLPDSVTSIGTEAFSYCKALNEISFGSNLKTIKASAFVNCEDLERINIKNLAAWCETELENKVFIVLDEYGNENFEKERRLYLNGEQITNLVIPEGVTKISDYAFYNFKGLETLTTPESLKTISEYAFTYSDFSSITLAGNLESIGEFAFYDCDSLISLTITSSTDAEHTGMIINSNAFRSCENLETITFADCIKEIDYGTFEHCNKLKTVYFENPDVFSYTWGYRLSDPYEAAKYLRNGSRLH